MLTSRYQLILLLNAIVCNLVNMENSFAHTIFFNIRKCTEWPLYDVEAWYVNSKLDIILDLSRMSKFPGLFAPWVTVLQVTGHFSNRMRMPEVVHEIWDFKDKRTWYTLGLSWHPKFSSQKDLGTNFQKVRRMTFKLLSLKVKVPHIYKLNIYPRMQPKVPPVSLNALPLLR